MAETPRQPKDDILDEAFASVHARAKRLSHIQMQLTAEQRGRALALLEQMPWDDMDRGICDLELALRRALEVTADDFRRWDEYLEPDLEARGFDEFHMPPGVVEAMSDEDKLATSLVCSGPLLCRTGSALDSEPAGVEWSARPTNHHPLLSFEG